MRRKLKADLSLSFVTIFWGSTFPLLSLALVHIGTFSFIAARNILAALLLLLIFHNRIKNINRSTIIAAIIIGLPLFFGNCLQTFGLLYTTPSKSGFISGLYIVFVPLIIICLTRKLPRMRTFLGLLFALFGLYFMSLYGVTAINLGDAITIISAIFYSFQILLVDKYAATVDVILLTALELLVVGGISFFPGLIIEGFRFDGNLFTIFVIIYTAVFCTSLALVVQNKMQPRTDPTHAAIIYLAEPVFGAIFSIFIGDIMTRRTLIGCSLIFIGMIIISIKTRKIKDI